MERIKDRADLQSPRPVLNPFADVITQGSPITAVIGDTAIDVVGPP